MYQLDVVHFDTKANRLIREDDKVDLDRQSGLILAKLIETNGPCSKQALCDEIWAGKVVSDAAITTAIRRLRRAFETLDSEQEYIVTLPKIGYDLAHYPKPADSDTSSSVISEAQGKPVRQWPFAIGLMLLLMGILVWSGAFQSKPLNYPPQYAQALHLWEQKKPELVPQVIDYLEQSLEEAPELVDAHMLLAQIYGYKMSRYLDIGDDEIIERAQFHIAQADTLSPDNPGVDLARAKLAFFYQRQIGVVDEYVARYANSRACDAECHFFIAYTSPVLNKAEIGVEHAELAYASKPDSELYVWERMWTNYMAGNLMLAEQRRVEAERFTGEPNRIARAMIAQARGDDINAIRYWIDAKRSEGAFSQQTSDILVSLIAQHSPAYVASALLDELTNLAVDQKISILLLAGRIDEGLNELLVPRSLKEQTHLLWAHKTPLFSRYFSPAQLETIYQHIWQSSQ